MANDEEETAWLTVTEKLADCEEAPFASLAVTLKLNVPTVVGMPLIVLPLKASPGGSAPLVDQV